MTKRIGLPLLFLVILLFSPYVSFGQKLEIKEHHLKNGMMVLTLERHTSPTVSFHVWYRVGSRNERPGITGISHMLEHMLYKGTEKYGSGEVSRIVQRNGGNWNGATYYDWTRYYENFASDRLEIALELESDRMENALIDSLEFEPEREVVKEERRVRTENSPYGLLFEEFMAAAYTAHPYQWPIIGWMSDIESMTREDVVNHYETYYAPNNAVAVLAGDFDTEKTVLLIDKYFGRISRGKKVPPVTTVEPEQRGERRIWVHKEGRLPALLIGYHTPEIGHPDFYVLDVIGNILSMGGRSSRLYKIMVYEKGISLFVEGFVPDRADPSIFQIFTGLRQGRTTDEAEEAIYAILDSLKTAPVTDRELEMAKNNMKSQFYFRQQSNFQLAELIGSYETQGVGYDYINTYVERTEAVTKEDIMRVAEKYFRKKNRTVAILVPEPLGK